jgi:hypothetical protein
LQRLLHPGIIFLKTQYADVSRTVAQVVEHTDRMSKEEFRNSKLYVP